VGSNPGQGIDVCPRCFCVVLSCVGRGLATGRFILSEFNTESQQARGRNP